jgi:hypothetical protein
MPVPVYTVVLGYYLVENGVAMFREDGSPMTSNGNMDWYHVMWGDPATGRMGRIPTALLHAYHEKAERLIWSCGNSWTEDGQSEAHWTRNYALHHFADLREDFPAYFTHGWFKRESAFRNWLDRISLFEMKSVNTATTMEELIKLINHSVAPVDFAQLAFVASANFAPRVTKLAALALHRGLVQETGKPPRPLQETPLGIMLPIIVPASTCYTPGKDIADVIVNDTGALVPSSWVKT